MLFDKDKWESMLCNIDFFMINVLGPHVMFPARQLRAPGVVTPTDKPCSETTRQAAAATVSEVQQPNIRATLEGKLLEKSATFPKVKPKPQNEFMCS